MSCIICFFDTNNQKKLRNECDIEDRFEKKLSIYRDIFIESLESLQKVEQCECLKNKNNKANETITALNNYLEILQGKKELFINIFNELISIYQSYITKSQYSALDKFWVFFKKYKLDQIKVDEDILNKNLWYRCRNKKDDLPKDIYHFYHIPFNKRGNISNQRFSISGQPMLYLANSLYIATKELGKDIYELETSAFFLNRIKNQKIYNLRNTLFKEVVNISRTLSSLENNKNNNTDELINKIKELFNSIDDKDIAQYILASMCTFKKNENSKSHIAEYVMPQMLTSLLLKHNYAGIFFPSTKDLSDMTIKFTDIDYDLNLALFVNYSYNDNYDEDLLKSLDYYLINNNKTSNIKLEDAIQFYNSLECKEYFSKIFIFNETVNLKNRNLNGIDYYESIVGEAELEFIMKFLNG